MRLLTDGQKSSHGRSCQCRKYTDTRRSTHHRPTNGNGSRSNARGPQDLSTDLTLSDPITQRLTPTTFIHSPSTSTTRSTSGILHQHRRQTARRHQILQISPLRRDIHTATKGVVQHPPTKRQQPHRLDERKRRPSHAQRDRKLERYGQSVSDDGAG